MAIFPSMKSPERTKPQQEKNWLRPSGVLAPLLTNSRRYLWCFPGSVEVLVLAPPIVMESPLRGSIRHDDERSYKVMSGSNSILTFRRITTCSWVRWENMIASSPLKVGQRHSPKKLKWKRNGWTGTTLSKWQGQPCPNNLQTQFCLDLWQYHDMEEGKVRNYSYLITSRSQDKA